MKRRVGIFVLFCFLINLTACGGGNSNSKDAEDAAYKACYGYISDGSYDKTSPQSIAYAEVAKNLDPIYTRLYESIIKYKIAQDAYDSSSSPIPDEIRAQAIVTLMVLGNECDRFFAPN